MTIETVVSTATLTITIIIFVYVVISFLGLIKEAWRTQEAIAVSTIFATACFCFALDFLLTSNEYSLGTVIITFAATIMASWSALREVIKENKNGCQCAKKEVNLK
jgi:hypothetical protein